MIIILSLQKSTYVPGGAAKHEDLQEEIRANNGRKDANDGRDGMAHKDARINS